MTRPDRDLLLCRDCCCGTAKHPEVDHDAQRDALLACAGAGRRDDGTGGVRVRVVDCLSECERSNVALVRDFTAGRRPRDTWLGELLDEETTAAVAAWVRQGGPLPAGLERHVFRGGHG